MRMVAWNCRGSRSDLSIRRIRDTLRATQPDILFISETHSSLPHIRNLVSRLPMQFSHIVSTCGRSRGLWLCWNGTCSLTVFYDCPNYVLAEVTHNSDTWFLACVFGAPKPNDHNKIWMELVFMELLSTTIITKSGWSLCLRLCVSQLPPFITCFQDTWASGNETDNIISKCTKLK